MRRELKWLLFPESDSKIVISLETRFCQATPAQFIRYLNKKLTQSEFRYQ